MAPQLIRARYVGACARATQEPGTRVEPMLERAGIPVQCTADETALIPVPHFTRFLAAACAGMDVGAFCYCAAPKNLAEYGALGQQLAAAETLQQAIDAQRLGATELSNCVIKVDRWNQRTWLYMKPETELGDGASLYMFFLRPMLEMLRLVAGDSWWPKYVSLPCRHSNDIERLDFAAHSDIAFNEELLAVEIPHALLSKPLCKHQATSHDARGADNNEIIPSDFTGAIRSLLASYVGRRSLRISEIAEIACVSVRSVQRELRRAHTSYSDLVQQARFSAAVVLLLDGQQSITDVAYDMGYSDPAHFSRAFQRLAGAPPRDFRQRPPADVLASLAAAR